jgi:hypothetical protein
MKGKRVNRMSWASGVTLTIALAGCAGTPPVVEGGPAAAASQPTGVVCKAEKPLGSHIPETRCKPREGTRQEKSSVGDFEKSLDRGQLPPLDTGR